MPKAINVKPERRRMAIADLRPNPDNPRRMSDSALDGLDRGVQKFGLVQDLVWNRRTKNLIAGHQRLKVLERHGVEEVDVVVLSLSKRDEHELMVHLNNPWTQGRFTDALDELLQPLRSGKDFEPLRLDQLLTPAARATDEVEAPEPPKVAVTKPGDIWRLGRHRLRCGDATDADDVAAAFGPFRPFLMSTDPPYGVDYDPSWREEAYLKGQAWAPPRRVGKVDNDDRADWAAAYLLFPGDVAYVWHSALFADVVLGGLRAAGFELRAQIIGVKPVAPMSRGHYNWKHEPCWYVVRKGKSAAWVGDKKQTTCWEMPTPPRISEGGEATFHGTQKPVECMARPMRNHGDRDTVVYDPFLGSGTTLIAAEQLERVCVGLELRPEYCDVIVERWQAHTGHKAKRQQRAQGGGKKRAKATR